VRVYVWPEVIPYIRLIEEACKFWRKYTNLNFEIITNSEKIPPEFPYIALHGKFNESPYVAFTQLGYSNPPYEIASGSVILYAPWLSKTEIGKIETIMHEIGHVFLTPATMISEGHTNDGSIMDANLGSRMLHTYQQLAIKIMYTKNPGDSI